MLTSSPPSSHSLASKRTFSAAKFDETNLDQAEEEIKQPIGTVTNTEQQQAKKIFDGATGISTPSRSTQSHHPSSSSSSLSTSTAAVDSHSHAPTVADVAANGQESAPIQHVNKRLKTEDDPQTSLQVETKADETHEMITTTPVTSQPQQLEDQPMKTELDSIPSQSQPLSHPIQTHEVATLTVPSGTASHHHPVVPRLSQSPFPYTLPPVSGIRSPRRALVCASLESAAEASALLTHTAIHPAILHSLSIRLQAMNDTEAEIVLQRLQRLAQHIENQNNQHKAHQQTVLQRMQAATQRNTSPWNSSGPGGTAPLSPTMPNLASISSTDTNDTSNTTSPTISPAVRCITPYGPPTEISLLKGHTLHEHDAPGSGSSSVGVVNPFFRDQTAVGPPLHPPSASGQSPLYSNASTQSDSHRLSGPAGRSDLSSNESDRSNPPSLVRSGSENTTNIPLGLMMLIQALPGTSQCANNSAGDLAGLPSTLTNGSSKAAQMTNIDLNPDTNPLATTITPAEFSLSSFSSLSNSLHPPKQRVDACTNTAIGNFSRTIIGLPPPMILRRSTSF